MTHGTWLLLSLSAGVMTVIWIGWDEPECAVLGGLATLGCLVGAFITWIM